MVQPKTPPLSIRLPSALLAEVDAWAQAHQCKRHTAIVALLAKALSPEVATMTPLLEIKIPPGPDLKDGEVVRFGNDPPVRITVPLAGTFKRPIYQKGTKK